MMDTITTTPVDAPATLQPDLLDGADAIALFLWDKPDRYRVYRLARKKGLPVFRLNGVICARRSVVLRWITLQEQGHSPDEAQHLISQSSGR